MELKRRFSSEWHPISDCRGLSNLNGCRQLIGVTSFKVNTLFYLLNFTNPIWSHHLNVVTMYMICRLVQSWIARLKWCSICSSSFDVSDLARNCRAPPPTCLVRSIVDSLFSTTPFDEDLTTFYRRSREFLMWSTKTLFSVNLRYCGSPIIPEFEDVPNPAWQKIVGTFDRDFSIWDPTVGEFSNNSEWYTGDFSDMQDFKKSHSVTAFLKLFQSISATPKRNLIQPPRLDIFFRLLGLSL